MPDATDFKTKLRELLRGYKFDVEGLYHSNGRVRPLPRESSVVGKVLEESVKEHLARAITSVPGITKIEGGPRSYPDLTFEGPSLEFNRYAVDVTSARRNSAGTQTTSPIAIGTYDAEYFHYPQAKVTNIVAPYGSYAAHLSLIALYSYDNATARDVSVLVVEKWRVATHQRASGTRCYIAAVKDISRLRNEDGEFASEEEFNAFWRSKPVKEEKVANWDKRHGSNR
jgi:hypothetical protein